jgi:hypothetical protein
VLNFYGDASGTSDQTNVAVGGYISTVDRWNKLRTLWEAELKKEDVDYFRRSQMEPPFRGEFARLGWTKAHQNEVLSRLHRIIKRHTIMGAAKAVRNRAFAELMPSPVKRLYGGPYGWAVLLTLVDIGLWARRRGHWVHYFFECGDAGQGQTNVAIKELQRDPTTRDLFRIASWTFVPKKGPQGVVQLQSADFIAYEAYKDIENYLSGNMRDPRKSRQDLVRKGIDLLNFWADAAFSKWLLRIQDCNGNVIDSLVTSAPNT